MARIDYGKRQVSNGEALSTRTGAGSIGVGEVEPFSTETPRIIQFSTYQKK